MSDVIDRITRLRRLLYVHSTLYYRMNESIVSDRQFDAWAYELAELQRQYPEESVAAPFHAEFTGWDGTTGFHLQYNAWAVRKATELIEISRRITAV